MDNQPWLGRVRQRLAKHGLPPSYVQRFVEELSDHFQDLKEEHMEADAYSRLGEPEQVADAAVAAYRRRSFLGRHPAAAFLVFGISPVVSLVALMALAFVMMWGVDCVGGQLGFSIEHFLTGLKRCEPFASVALPYGMSLLTVVIPCIVASILYCRLATRLGIGKKWMLLSCAMLAVLAALPCCSVKFSPLPGQSALTWGVWNPWDPQAIRHQLSTIVWIFCQPRQLMQFLVPVAIGLWFMRRKRESGRLQVAS